MIKKAEVKDLDGIMEVIKATIAEMKTYGNTQWDENYPQKWITVNKVDKKNDIV